MIALLLSLSLSLSLSLLPNIDDIIFFLCTINLVNYTRNLLFPDFFSLFENVDSLPGHTLVEVKALLLARYVPKRIKALHRLCYAVPIMILLSRLPVDVHRLISNSINSLHIIQTVK